jgi:hypothetical protein
LKRGDLGFKLYQSRNPSRTEDVPSMSAATGTDWTRILADPDLVRHVGKLLQAYREAPAEKREQALLDAMREIKAGGSATGKTAGKSAAGAASEPRAVATPASATPPFEPDLFSPNWGSDRRRHPRIKCFVAVELRVDETPAPIWGNLSNTSVGGCLVETAQPVKPGSKVEIGLWVPNGKIWVKGFALSGVVSRNGPANGIRVNFAGMAPAERDSLREFLKFVQQTTRGSQNENGYFNLLK